MNITLKNISQVSFFFFWVLGLAQLFVSFWVLKGLRMPVFVLLHQNLDLPFIFSALTYGSARASLQAEKMGLDSHRVFQLCVGLSLLIFLATLFINFSLPDAQL